MLQKGLSEFRNHTPLVKSLKVNKMNHNTLHNLSYDCLFYVSVNLLLNTLMNVILWLLRVQCFNLLTSYAKLFMHFAMVNTLKIIQEIHLENVQV